MQPISSNRMMQKVFHLMGDMYYHEILDVWVFYKYEIKPLSKWQVIKQTAKMGYMGELIPMIFRKQYKVAA